VRDEEGRAKSVRLGGKVRDEGRAESVRLGGKGARGHEGINRYGGGMAEGERREEAGGISGCKGAASATLFIASCKRTSLLALRLRWMQGE